AYRRRRLTSWTLHGAIAELRAMSPSGPGSARLARRSAGIGRWPAHRARDRTLLRAGARVCCHPFGWSSNEEEQMSLFDLTGKVAVITGASRGIGRAIAERMAEQGAKVVISSRKLAACETVVEGIRARGGEAIAVACNIGRKEELQALVDATNGKWGRIDILVCNAAVNPYFGPS